MNRFAALGIAVAAAEGRRLAVLSRESGLVDMVLAQTQPEDIRHVSRANGRERILFTQGGSVSFFSPRSSLRGCTFDDIYLDHGVESGRDVIDELQPALSRATGDGGIHRC